MIETNLKEVDFLDVSFNLRNGNCRPYKNPNGSLTFLIIKLPTKRHQTNSIQARLSKNSSDKEICNTAKCGYKDALKKSEFNVDFKYIKNQRKKTKNRSRNIIWFNPPFNKAVSTNIGKIFLRLINRHFPKFHRLHKVFSRNTVKVSCSCIQNMSKI